jgi:predicted kinase
MKENIKSILREGSDKNTLGVTVTRPNQELIVMRGIPGSGKSTKAKSLVGGGKIHSTDDLIDASGDYREFFAKMIASGDFSPLSKMHSKNLNDAKESMKTGVSPVIVDNTNIKQNEAKSYVVAALQMGYADNNIKFVDIGTAGLDAEVLAKRNTHGVPLDKIRAMIASHTSQGPLTLKSILDAKDMYPQSDVLYSAVVLDAASKTKLLDLVHDKIPQGWTPFAHHMTIVFGKGVKNKEDLGKKVTLTVTHVGLTDKVIAVQVEGYESANKVPHITVAVNPDGGKPVMSNDITNWQNVKPFVLMGVVTEVKKK